MYGFQIGPLDHIYWLAQVAGCCGSLQVPYYHEAWRTLAQLLRDGNDPEAVAYWAEELALVAIPDADADANQPHPQRAEVGVSSNRSTRWRTPGGVDIDLRWVEVEGTWGYVLDVHFRRDSKQLASEMLAVLAVTLSAPQQEVWGHYVETMDQAVCLPAGKALAIELLRASSDSEADAAMLLDRHLGATAEW